MRREKTERPPTDDVHDDGTSPVDRRSYLRFAGTAVAATGGVANFGVAAATRRVDVADLGVDGSGSNRINDALERVHGDGVEVHFPPGEYLLEPISLEGSGWSLRGDDATLVVPASVDGDYLSFGGSNWTVEGFTVDLSAGGAAPANELRGDDWTFRDVEFVGRADASGDDESPLLSAAVESDDATGRLERVVATAGRGAPADPAGRRPLGVDSDSEGKLNCRGCEFAGPASGRLSVADGAGPVVVEDSLFENLGVRVGGDAAVRNCAWRTAGRDDSADAPAAGGGLEIRGGRDAEGETTVEACEFELRGSDAPAVSARGRADVALRDTRIEQANGRPAVRLSGRGTTVVERTSVTGDSDAPAIDVAGRDGTVARNVCVDQPGVGIRVADADDCRVVDSTVDVGGDAIVSDGAAANVTTRDVSFDGACPAPRLSRSGENASGSSAGRHATESAELPNTLTIEGTGVPATYEFTVGGELERVSPTSHPDAWDGVSGTTATGWVSTPKCADTFRFSGSVTDFGLLTGDATVYVDGERTDPSALSSETSLPRTITVTGAGAAAEYEFAVDGELEADPGRGDSDQWDNVSGAVASGWVATDRHVDSYRFSGRVTEFTVREGPLSVAVDGDEVDPSRL